MARRSRPTAPSMEHDATLPFPDRDEAAPEEPAKAEPERAEPARAEPEPELAASRPGQNKKSAAGRMAFPLLGGSNLARRYASGS